MWLLSESVCKCSFAKVANAHGSAVAMRKDFSITRFLTTRPVSGPIAQRSKTQNQVEDINKEAIQISFAADKQEPGIGPELLILRRRFLKHRSQPNRVLARRSEQVAFWPD